MKGLNLNRLYVFHVIAELGSLEKAAAHLRKAESSLSEMMKRFQEVDVKQKLLTRAYLGLALTDEGQKLRADTMWFFIEADLISGNPVRKQPEVKDDAAEV